MIKKAFFDMWDNLLSIMLLNVGFSLVIGVVVYFFYVLSFYPPLSILGIIFGVVIVMLYTGATSMVARDIADYKTPSIKNFFGYFKEIWQTASLFFLIMVFQGLVFSLVLPWYYTSGNIFGIMIAGLLFWINVIWVLASQYFFPVKGQLNPALRKIPQKCLILFFDNAGFTIFVGIGVLLLIILSSFTAFLLPGFGTVLLWHQVGLKLRLYKYDYLEDHPQANRKKIPWDLLLQEERKLVGKRTLRGMIFPWKE